MWPFAFIIPSHAAFAPGAHLCGSTELFECESPWRGSSDAETLLLPPSMFCEAGFTCAVHYGLHARLIRPPTSHLLGGHDLSVYASVKLRPTLVCPDILSSMNTGHFQYIDCTLRKKAPWKVVLLRFPLGPSNKCIDQKFQDELRQTTLRLRVFVPSALLRECNSPIQVFLRAIPPDTGQQNDSVFVKKIQLGPDCSHESTGWAETRDEQSCSRSDPTQSSERDTLRFATSECSGPDQGLLLSAPEGQAFLPPSGTHECDGPPPGYYY
ncbi:hypothetical protein B7463_g2235, partial [Scytalidium lignicola]